MKEHGLVFCPEMIQAFLREKDPKTMTRRRLPTAINEVAPSAWRFENIVHKGNVLFAWFYSDLLKESRTVRVPYTVGDLVYAKETVYVSPVGKHQYHRPTPAGQRLLPGWRVYTPRFMPKIYARIWRKITESRPPERVQSITREDALREGIRPDQTMQADTPAVRATWPIECFRQLWGSLHGPGAWERNDFVWPLVLKPTPSPAGQGEIPDGAK